jgi:hypothetical protein
MLSQPDLSHLTLELENSIQRIGNLHWTWAGLAPKFRSLHLLNRDSDKRLAICDLDVGSKLA